MDCQIEARNRAADDVAKNLLEGALDLAKAGEHVARIVPRLESGAIKKAPPIGEVLLVEAPSAGSSAGGCDEAWVIALVEQMQDGILVERQILRADLGGRAELVAKLPGQRIEPLDDTPDVGARPFGLIDGQTPDRLAFHVIAAQRRALASNPLGQEWIAVY